MNKTNLPTVYTEGPSVVERMAGGGLEGAERTSRETALWSPAMGSIDRIVNRAKPLADARARDMFNNDGYTHGMVTINKDSIVGGQYKLNVIPIIRVLQSISKAFDEDWAIEFQQTAEARFELLAESEDCWLDSSGINNFTGLIRLGVGSDAMTGEQLATVDWFNRDRSRPLKTAVQMCAPSRLENPNGMPDNGEWSRGVRKNAAGKPVQYCFRNYFPGDPTGTMYDWKIVDARKPWGRRQVIHLYEQQEPGQTRGIADIVAALKPLRMTKNFSDLTLQQAVVNASIAMAIESELPPDAVYGMIGGGSGPKAFEDTIGAYLTLLQSYFGAANNVAIDGTSIPVLPPGTKLNARNLATPGGVSGEYGDSLLRHACAALGISFEEFSRNYSNVSYSGLKGAFASTEKTMKARKKRGADRMANNIWALVLEEEIGAGNIPLPRGVSREFFYLPLMKEAICRADWIGAGRGQIDEYKETQAAVLRVEKGLSTRRQEIARLGGDYRETFNQLAREKQMMDDLELDFSAAAAAGTAGNDNTDNEDLLPQKSKNKGKS